MSKVKLKNSQEGLVKKLEQIWLEKSSVLAWVDLGSLKIIADLRIAHIDPITSKIIVGPHGLAIENLKRVLSLKNFNIFLPNHAVSFKAELLSVDDDYIMKLKLPKKYKQVERRKKNRIDLNPSDISLKFNKLHSDKKENYQNIKVEADLLNISNGGFSFSLSRELMDFFSKGELLQDLTIDLGEKTLNLDGTIVAKKLTSGQEMGSISVRFESLNTPQKYDIDRYILSCLDLSKSA